MLKEFTNLWFESKSAVRDRLQKMNIPDDVDSYSKLLTIMLEEFNKVIEINDPFLDYEQFKTNIQQIDYGDYQGTLILTFAKNTYQPNIYETYYTYVNYGSCAGCDTLKNIIYSSPFCSDEYEELDDDDKAEYDKYKEEQVEDLLKLCLHMVEKIKCFNEFDG